VVVYSTNSVSDFIDFYVTCLNHASVIIEVKTSWHGLGVDRLYLLLVVPALPVIRDRVSKMLVNLNS